MKYLIIIAALFAATSASAATCADKSTIVERLETLHNETLVLNMLLSSQAILEVYASSEFETWSITVTDLSRNLICVEATGKGIASYNLYIRYLEDSSLI